MMRRGLSSWDLLFMVSLAIAGIAAYFAFLAPPSSKPRTTRKAPTIQQVRAESLKLEQELTASKQQLTGRTWPMSAEVLSSELLNKLQSLASSHQLQVSDFRSGRILSAANLWEVTFTVALEGGFMDVMRAVEALEDPSFKVALNQLKIGSKNESDRVTAVLSLTGFLVKEGK